MHIPKPIMIGGLFVGCVVTAHKPENICACRRSQRFSTS